MRVLMIGPHLDYRGGIPSVERTMLDHAPPEMELLHVGTVHEGPAARKAIDFVFALAKGVPILVRWRPDVAHIHFSKSGSAVRKSAFTTLCRVLKVPVVLHAHSGAFDQFWSRCPTTVRWLIARGFHQCALLVVQSADMVPFYAKAFRLPEDSILTMGNPVDSIRVRTCEDNLKGEVVRFVFLGRVCRAKGAFDLVQVVNSASRQLRGKASFVLAGDGETMSVRACVSNLGVSDLIDVKEWLTPTERDRILEAGDVFVLPSYSEALPMALLEAMAAGLAPIVTPVGAIPSLVRDGVSGLVVNPGDVVGLENAILRMVEDQVAREAIAQNARLAVRPYEANAYMHALAGVYASVTRVRQGTL